MNLIYGIHIFLFSSQELTHYSNADDVEVSFRL